MKVALEAGLQSVWSQNRTGKRRVLEEDTNPSKKEHHRAVLRIRNCVKLVDGKVATFPSSPGAFPYDRGRKNG